MMQLKLSELNGLSVGNMAFNEARVEIGGDILSCLFTVTRLPVTPDLILVPGGDGFTRLRPLIERAGFRTADDFTAEPTPAGTASAIIQPIASNLQQSVLKADPARVQYYKDQLAQYPKPWVGFCWTSGRAGQDFRTVPVYCAEMKAIPGTVVDLQYQTEPNPNADAMRDAFEQAGRPMVRFDTYDPVANIAEAAALYSALDVVMNTENANSGAVGGLGRGDIATRAVRHTGRNLRARQMADAANGQAVARRELGRRDGHRLRLHRDDLQGGGMRSMGRRQMRRIRRNVDELVRQQLKSAYRRRDFSQFNGQGIEPLRRTRQ